MSTPAITIPNLDNIRSRDPYLAEALTALQQALQNISTQTGADPTKNQASPPPQVQGLNVTASGGVHELTITDTSPISKNINYFAEYSATPGFQQPTVVDMGASRNIRLFLGNQNLYWRAYSQYRTSNPSPPVYFGTSVQPTVVQGGGSIIGPVLQSSAGSGTASNNGTQGGSGFGTVPYRGPGKLVGQ